MTCGEQELKRVYSFDQYLVVVTSAFGNWIHQDWLITITNQSFSNIGFESLHFATGGINDKGSGSVHGDGTAGSSQRRRQFGREEGRQESVPGPEFQDEETRREGSRTLEVSGESRPDGQRRQPVRSHAAIQAARRIARKV